MSIQVLVVDDYPMNRDLLRRILAEPEFSVIDAEDGLEALQLLSQHDFDVVLAGMVSSRIDLTTAPLMMLTMALAFAAFVQAASP